MRIMLLPPAQWPVMCRKLLAFAGRFGDNRLSAEGIGMLRELKPVAALQLSTEEQGGGIEHSDPTSAASSREWYSEQEVAIAVAVENGKLAGFAFAKDAGRLACLVVVHPQMRGHGVGKELLTTLHHHFGHLTCMVAADNPASMQMCFHAGMVAVELFDGPTGKPTLRFEKTSPE